MKPNIDARRPSWTSESPRQLQNGGVRRPSFSSDAEIQRHQEHNNDDDGFRRRAMSHDDTYSRRRLRSKELLGRRSSYDEVWPNHVDYLDANHNDVHHRSSENNVTLRSSRDEDTRRSSNGDVTRRLSRDDVTRRSSHDDAAHRNSQADSLVDELGLDVLGEYESDGGGEYEILALPTLLDLCRAAAQERSHSGSSSSSSSSSSSDNYRLGSLFDSTSFSDSDSDSSSSSRSSSSMYEDGTVSTRRRVGSHGNQDLGSDLEDIVLAIANHDRNRDSAV
jgi:hypothetical protein